MVASNLENDTLHFFACFAFSHHVLLSPAGRCSIRIVLGDGDNGSTEESSRVEAIA